MPARFALAVFLVLTAAGAMPAEGATLDMHGIVATEAQANGRIWFELENGGPEFLMDVKKVPSADALMDALEASNLDAKPLLVRIDLDSGRFEEGSGRPVFTVVSLEYGGKTVPGEARTEPAKTRSALDIAAADLAGGMVFLDVDDPDNARAAFGRAIDAKVLEPYKQAMALSMRGDLSQSEAFAKWPAGADRDRLLIAALNDYEAWKALAPLSGNATASVASTKALLGAYDEAVADYRAMIDKWPRNKRQTYAEIGRIYRMAGQYDKALGALDELVKAEGPQSGMPYHYHRGWTLNAMGRYDDAIVELTAGLKDQPDYSWAFMQRACAYGQTGKLHEAVADQEQAVKLLTAALSGTAVTPDMKANQDRAAAVLHQLRDAMAKDEHAKVDAACTGYAMERDAKRARSGLLPPPAHP